VAMTVRGFDSPALQFNEASWAEYQKRNSESYNGMRVITAGNIVTAGTGRTVDVSIIDAVLPGVWFVTDAATTAVAIAANAGTNRRIDYIVAEGDWTANTVTFKSVTGVAGTNPTAPALTQNAGSLWQMPLARVTVQGNATTIAAADIEVAVPRARKPRPPYRSAISVDTMRGDAATWNTIGAVDVVDPGWPYYLQVSGSARFDATTGFMRIRALDVPTNASLADGITGPLSAGRSTAQVSGVSDSMSGARRVRLEMNPNGMGAADRPTVVDMASNHFTVLVIPA
jgi:hypothetical protein